MKARLGALLLCGCLCGKAQNTVDNASFNATVYAVQEMADNGSATYMVNWATDSSGAKLSSEQAPIGSHLTRLEIDASAIPGTISSICVYANSKAAIAGELSYNGNSTTRPKGKAANAYASNGQSDVVMVKGVEKSCTAYLLPVTLKGGVKVTVHTTDGKYYTEDFSEDLTAGSTQLLTLTQTTANNLWMTTIPGNTYFNFVSTPGAHDAATSGVTSYTNASKCQGEDIATLLANGVRAFDLRPGYHYTSTINADNLYIYHGQVSTNVLYRDALEVLVNFVKENPSEAISIVMVKENCKPVLDLLGRWSDRSGEMWTVINALQEKYKSYMKVLDRANYTLDDVRGKICYVNRTGTQVPYTTQISNWPDNGTVSDYTCALGACHANVQDVYNANGTKKQDAVKGMLEMAAANTANKNIHYNFCSSANSPAKYAAETNPIIANYLNEGNIMGPTGYVYADFMGSKSNGGEALLNAIVEQNYRYVYQGRSYAEKLAVGIKSASVKAAGEGKIYDLQGRQQRQPARGMNIRNGMKVLVR